MVKFILLKNILVLLLLSYFPFSLPALAVNNNELSQSLITAAENNNLTRLQELLDRGEDPNQQDRFGYTALIWASRLGHVECTKILLDRGADPNLADDSGRTPLSYAVIYLDENHQKIVKYLFAKKADPNKKSSSGNTPFMNVAYDGDKKFIKLFFKNGADLNQSDNCGRSVLSFALKGRDQCQKKYTIIINQIQEMKIPLIYEPLKFVSKPIRGPEDCEHKHAEEILLIELPFVEYWQNGTQIKLWLNGEQEKNEIYNNEEGQAGERKFNLVISDHYKCQQKIEDIKEQLYSQHYIVFEGIPDLSTGEENIKIIKLSN